MLGTPGRPAFAAAILPALLAAPAGAQDAGLDWGPSGVGFRIVEARDSTRAFRAKRDVGGRVAGETARPVIVGLWYPAATSPDDPRMTVEDFRVLQERELDFGVLTPAERRGVRERFVETAARFGIDRDRARARLDAPTRVVRDAPASPGPHPVVLYVGAAYVNDPLTPAYLASHGFVVAAFPGNGRMTETSLEYSPNPLTLDTGVDDAGFVHAILRRLEVADTDRLALYAFSSPSLVALLWQMRDLQADALVSVEGWERYRRGVDTIRESVLYDPLRVRVPVLLLERAAAETSEAFAKVGVVVDSLVYASRTRVAFEGAEHGDFLSHAPDVGSPERDLIYAGAMRMVREFLDGALREKASFDAPDPVAGFTTVEVHEPSIVAPSEEELFRMAETDPVAFAEMVGDLVERGLKRPPFREHVLARAATFMDTAEDRATVWGVIVDVYPASTVSHVRLGESLAEAGRTGAARGAFENALGRVAGDPGLDEAARSTWRDRIESALAALGPEE